MRSRLLPKKYSQASFALPHFIPLGGKLKQERPCQDPLESHTCQRQDVGCFSPRGVLVYLWGRKLLRGRHSPSSVTRAWSPLWLSSWHVLKCIHITQPFRQAWSWGKGTEKRNQMKREIAETNYWLLSSKDYGAGDFRIVLKQCWLHANCNRTLSGIHCKLMSAR